jgi:hypothetical protein
LFNQWTVCPKNPLESRIFNCLGKSIANRKWQVWRNGFWKYRFQCIQLNEVSLWKGGPNGWRWAEEKSEDLYIVRLNAIVQYEGNKIQIDLKKGEKSEIEFRKSCKSVIMLYFNFSDDICFKYGFV